MTSQHVSIILFTLFTALIWNLQINVVKQLVWPTWLFKSCEDGLSAGVLRVRELHHAVVVRLVQTKHRPRLVRSCRMEREKKHFQGRHFQQRRKRKMKNEKKNISFQRPSIPPPSLAMFSTFQSAADGVRKRGEKRKDWKRFLNVR